jgi:hypothetical protein
MLVRDAAGFMLEMHSLAGNSLMFCPKDHVDASAASYSSDPTPCHGLNELHAAAFDRAGASPTTTWCCLYHTNRVRAPLLVTHRPCKETNSEHRPLQTPGMEASERLEPCAHQGWDVSQQ